MPPRGSSARPPAQVLLVHMPWGALERPALGLALLEAGLRERGVPCRTLYLNLPLADRLGAETYGWITHELPHIAFAGEWLFSEALHGRDDRRDQAYVQQVLRQTWQLGEADIARLWRARAEVEPFLAAALDGTDWGQAQVVGFTSTFEQNLASLALARRIKARHPAVLTAFGGANWEGPMGRTLHQAFDCVDLAFSGEADLSFPAALEVLRQHPQPGPARTRAWAGVGGMVFRDHRGGSVDNGPAAPIEAMDALPLPAFEPYFEARRASPAASEVPPVLLFEASRGCWWGAKSHCTFCGLNGHAMGYRSKSGPRLLAELEEMFRRWPCPTVEAVDNILDMAYFQQVLPALERQAPPGPVFFEVKANLKRHHVAQLARARVLRIQPGIESLSDHVLGLMRKGTTALRNVQLLKWCREYGVAVDWNLLYGFPGETDADYDAIIDLLPRLAHLQAPGACGPIRMDRFSPYFNDPAAHGLGGVRPLPVYRHLYPGLTAAQVYQVANYFEFDHQPGFEPSGRAQAAAQLAEALRGQGAGNGTLQAMPHVDGGAVVRDSRACAVRPVHRLDAVERALLEQIDELSTVRKVHRGLQARAGGDRGWDEAAVTDFLDRLVGLGLALRQGEGPDARYLGLVLMAAPMRAGLERASLRRLELPRREATAPAPARPATPVALAVGA